MQDIIPTKTELYFMGYETVVALYTVFVRPHWRLRPKRDKQDWLYINAGIVALPSISK